MMESKRKTPEIRFAGFEEEWKKMEASDIFQPVSDKGHPGLTILSASQEFGMIPRSENGIDMSYGTQNVATYKRVMPGQFIIHLRSFQGGFAHSEIEGITSPAYTVMRLNNKDRQYDIFWKYVLVSENFIKRLESVTYGIRDGKSIKYDDFANLKFYVPQKNEQQTISKFFKHINVLISQQRAENEKLHTLKFALLSSLFPQGIETHPRIRLNNFIGDWEVKQLSEIISPYREVVETPHDGYERLGIRSHGKGTFHSYVPKGAELETAQMSVVRANNLIVNITFGWELAVAITESRDEGKLVSHRFPQFSFNEGHVPLFYRYSLINNHFRKHLTLASPGSAGRNRVLKIDKMLEYKILVPSQEEQQAIADLLTEYDRLIRFNEQKLEKLRNLKQAMLDKMFV